MPDAAPRRASWFRRERTRIPPREAPPNLIVEGPFRSPIRMGFAPIPIGRTSAPGAFPVPIPAAIHDVLVTRRSVPAEVAGLRAAFRSDAARRFLRAGRR